MPLNLNTVLACIMSLTYMVVAVAFATLGFEWIHSHYGISPWVAFPLAVLCTIAAVFLPMYFMEAQRLDDELEANHDL